MAGGNGLSQIFVCRARFYEILPKMLESLREVCLELRNDRKTTGVSFHRVHQTVAIICLNPL